MNERICLRTIGFNSIRKTSSAVGHKLAEKVALLPLPVPVQSEVNPEPRSGASLTKTNLLVPNRELLIREILRLEKRVRIAAGVDATKELLVVPPD